MTGLSALNLPQPLVWILAFAIIFGLLAAFAHLLKRIAGGRGAELEGGRNRVPRLGLVDSFDLDRQRKLLIVRRDNVEHLILVGPTDVVVESNIVRAASASPVREDRQAFQTPPLQAPQPSVPMANAAPNPAQPASPVAQQRELPIPPVPAVPQAMQPSPPPVPPMPAAPFPIPQPVRATEPTRKSTMPPPPPFGAPKRGAGQTAPQRVEPVLTSPGAGAAVKTTPADMPKAGSDIPEAKLRTEKPVAPTPVADAIAEPAASLAAKPAAPTPVAPAPIAKIEPVPEPLPAATDPSPTPADVTLAPAKPTEPAPASTVGADPVLADLSTKLQDVLKANLRPEPAAAPAPALSRPPLPPLPPLPPQQAEKQAEKVEMSTHAPKPAVVEIVHAPEAPPEAAPPAPPVDAFEEELRRILGRSKQNS